MAMGSRRRQTAHGQTFFIVISPLTQGRPAPARRHSRVSGNPEGRAAARCHSPLTRGQARALSPSFPRKRESRGPRRRPLSFPRLRRAGPRPLPVIPA